MIRRTLFLLFGIMLGLFPFHSFAYDVAVKSTTNRGETDIGDYQLAYDFAKGFEALGKSVVIDYRGEYHRVHKEEPKLNLFMRGYTKFLPPYPEGVNVLYVYYPMTYNEKSAHKPSKKELNHRLAQPQDAMLDDDWQNFDILAVASASYAAELNKNGIKAIYVPQFTNPEKFYPEPVEELKTDILFVGSNWHDRTSLRFALEEGFEVDVYGYNWQGVVPAPLYKAPYIKNEELHRYYASAKIVLNDHRPDMKEKGFINNRIYDATAAGALVISDYMKEIEEVYGDSVPMYKNKEELKEKLAYYLSHEDKRLEKAQKAREITLKYFTNKAAAKKILEKAKRDDI
ncbi:MAG: glycosyltransferase family 1 protein [Alphaproteobacteria bacterium]|nr:glycosyltransferase family 1 protein [Alphaproteobacteria bacterium]